MMTYPMYGMNRPVYSNSNYRVRPVGSLEEAKASPIDFDGTLFYFHDVANKKIYTKQINLEGMVQIETYSIEIPVAAATAENPTVEYVTKEEFQEALQKVFIQLKGETKNDEQSVPTNSNFNF